ncbi:MAG: hypothetical protein ACOY45_07480 [Pseudomonadota bacterium]
MRRYLLALAIAWIALSAQTAPLHYSAGQVWQYRTRPQDAGSRVKIQRVERIGDSDVYHVSIVGLHFRTEQVIGTLPHLPVSRQTLDKSVTELAPSAPADFPDDAVDAGIAEWRRAEGGVFTISLAEIADFLDDQLSGAVR